MHNLEQDLSLVLIVTFYIITAQTNKLHDNLAVCQENANATYLTSYFS